MIAVSGTHPFKECWNGFGSRKSGIIDITTTVTKTITQQKHVPTEVNADGKNIHHRVS